MNDIHPTFEESPKTGEKRTCSLFDKEAKNFQTGLNVEVYRQVNSVEMIVVTHS